MRIGLDATPLLGSRTGVGRYTQSLLRALAAGADGDQLVATAFTFRGRGGLTAAVPAGVQVAARPAPARALQEAWARVEWPPVEALAGRVDVFHGTNFVLPPCRRAAGVVTVHDLAYLTLPGTVSAASRRYRELVPRSLRRAAVVLTPSEAVAEQVRDCYAPTVPVLATPLGVDPAWHTAVPPTAAERTRLGLPERYLLFVGTREPRKDLSTLLAAHRLLRAGGRGDAVPSLVLVGGVGWGEPEDVGHCVTPGYLDDEALRPVVAGAAAVVVPSRDEGFGLPVLEALAAGTPVVASDLPVLREVGGDLVTYAEVGSAESFAAALAGVLADRGGPGVVAARRARAAGFTWARCAAATRAAYAVAVQGRG